MSDGYINSARALLAVAFPPQAGLPGATVRLVHLAVWQPRLMSKREAARLIFERNMECYAPGKGHRALRRLINSGMSINDAVAVIAQAQRSKFKSFHP